MIDLFAIHWKWIGDDEPEIITGIMAEAPLPEDRANARCHELNILFPDYHHWVEKAPKTESSHAVLHPVHRFIPASRGSYTRPVTKKMFMPAE